MIDIDDLDLTPDAPAMTVADIPTALANAAQCDIDAQTAQDAAADTDRRITSDRTDLRMAQRNITRYHRTGKGNILRQTQRAEGAARMIAHYEAIAAGHREDAAHWTAEAARLRQLAADLAPAAAAPLDVTDTWQVSTKGGVRLWRVQGAQYADAKRAADLAVGDHEDVVRDGGYVLRRMVRDAAGELAIAPDPVPPTGAQRTAMAEEIREGAREGLRLGRITAAQAAELETAAAHIERT